MDGLFFYFDSGWLEGRFSRNSQALRCLHASANDLHFFCDGHDFVFLIAGGMAQFQRVVLRPALVGSMNDQTDDRALVNYQSSRSFSGRDVVGVMV